MVRYWYDIVCCPLMRNLSTCHTYRYCALKNLLCIIKYHQVHCSNMEIMKFPLCTISFNLFNAYKWMYSQNNIFYQHNTYTCIHWLPSTFHWTKFQEIIILNIMCLDWLFRIHIFTKKGQHFQAIKEKSCWSLIRCICIQCYCLFCAIN